MTATQKAILKAVGITANDIKLKAKELGEEMLRIEKDAAEKKDVAKEEYASVASAT